MLPKPIRIVFYKVLRSGKAGRAIADALAWGFYGWVKMFRLKPKQDAAGLVVISHRYKFIYFGLPKVASRSFYNLFVVNHAQDFDIEWSEKRGGFDEAIAAYPDYFRFAFVRNPWSRIVSCYESKIADNVIGKRARILSFYKGLKGGEAFADFVNWLCGDEGRDEIADRHWLSQHVFLYGDDGRALCDFVGRYENLDTDWAAVCEKIGMPLLPLEQKGFVSAEGAARSPVKAGGSEIKVHDTHDYYDEKLCMMIAERYARDIEVFGYAF
jgi:hypothetical protein